MNSTEILIQIVNSTKDTTALKAMYLVALEEEVNLEIIEREIL